MDSIGPPDSPRGMLKTQPDTAAPLAHAVGPAWRSSLPYGAVMATAGASVLAGRCGLHALTTPLLALAVAQALWVPASGAWRHWREPHWLWRAWSATGPAQRLAGLHTVPLGLAVITGGLATLAAGDATFWYWMLACICLGLTWLLTVACVGRFVWSLVLCDVPLQTLGGAWFLVPAALLGAGMAADAIALRVSGNATSVLEALALAAALAGWLGYLAVAWAAMVRVWRYGLGGVPQAPWWIAMGCAGLAAAALGGAQAPYAGEVWIQESIRQAMAGTVAAAIVLCVPILVGGTVFLLHRCRYRAPAAWPPTFSTAVFALGCLGSGHVLHSPPLRLLGVGAGYATLVFWTVTSVWNAGYACTSHLRLQ